MTQAVNNTFNNIDQLLSTQKDVCKAVENTDVGMDKSTDFKKVFETTLDKKDSMSKKVESTATSDNEASTIAKIKKENSNELTIASEEFKEILSKVTEEANIETSLDLTLARDINEIISQLKEAVENASELIGDTSVSSDEDLVIDEFATIDEELAVELENEEELSTEDSQKDQECLLEQVLIPIENKLSKLELNTNSEIVELNSVEEIASESLNMTESFEPVQAEIIEFAESTVDETVAVKQVDDKSDLDFKDLDIDEELVKELKIESFSSNTQADSSAGDNLMQNQTPQEHAVKAMINVEAEPFDLKIEAGQSMQSTPAVQVKSVEINPSRILDQISKQLDSLQNGGKVNIVLNPESLGKVNIQLLNAKDGLTAQFTVTTQEAKDLLTKGLEGLKESLGTHGVAVDNISIKVADSQKSEYNPDWTEQEGSNGRNKGQGQPNREEKEKGLFEKLMAQTNNDENGNV